MRFWTAEEGEPRLGHSINLSPRGMFIGTGRPVGSGERIRLEILDPEHGFVVEGVVTHSRRVAPELRRLKQSGMGVRFLEPAELVGDLVEPMARAAPTTEHRPATQGGSAGYAVRFQSPAHFLKVYRDDVAHGGLFVSTRNPAELDAVVSVMIYPPGPSFEPLVLEARVVQRVEPSGKVRDGTPLSGMGVEFLDADEALERLAVVARRLGR